jgi:hypothetical protein
VAENMMLGANVGLMVVPLCFDGGQSMTAWPAQLLSGQMWFLQYHFFS